MRLEIAQTAARRAGQIQQQVDRHTLGVDVKSSSIDLVTQIDRDSDAVIQHVLSGMLSRENLTPQAIITEETIQSPTELSALSGKDCWVVDPLDGTTNFAHGFPHFAVSIAYLENGHPVIGLVFDVSRNEMFWSVKGHGAYLNGKRLFASKTPSLNQALLATGFPYTSHQDPLENLGTVAAFLAQCHGIRRPGAAALDLAYVASGRLDGFWERKLSPWDVAAGCLLVSEAGGTVTSMDNTPYALAQERIDIVAAGNKTLHNAMVEIIAKKPTLVWQ